MGCMNESEFYRDTQNKALRGAYLLCGAEELTKQEALERVKKQLDPGCFALNCQSMKNPEPGEFLSACNQLPFFDGFRLVIAEGFGEDFTEALLKKGALFSLPDTAVALLLLRGQPPKTGKLYKAFTEKGRAVLFDRLTPERAVNFLLRESGLKNVSLERSAAKKLVDMVGCDGYTLKNEFSKAADYAGPGEAVTEEVLSRSVTPNLEYTVFNLLDALLAGRLKEGYAMLLSSLQSGESALGLASFMEGRMKLMLQARELLDTGAEPRSAVRQLPGSAYAAEIAVKNAQKHTAGELRRAVTSLAGVDAGVKQGLIKDTDGLLLAVFSIFTTQGI